MIVRSRSARGIPRAARLVPRVFAAALLLPALLAFLPRPAAAADAAGPAAGASVATASNPAASAPVPSRPNLGNVDEPVAPVLTVRKFPISGWAISPAGVARVDVVIDGKARIPAILGVSRPDVAGAHPGYPDAARSGYEQMVDLEPHGPGAHEITVELVDKAGNTTWLGRREAVQEGFNARWAPLLVERGRRANDAFHVAFATSGVTKRGGGEVDAEYRPYASRTMKYGVRVPILYLRTTLGHRKDWVFDPKFDVNRSCRNGKQIVDDSLDGVIRWSIANKIPVLFTLNGGVWADASCDVPEWDVNDHLEQNPANCQWNEKNKVMPDDFLQHLPGSQDAPELARALAFNVHAAPMRHYKKRNLQAAAKIIRRFAAQYPDLFIGVSLDPDLVVNPFFAGEQWYDYNPKTLQQFREWLSTTGPYKGDIKPGEPNLSEYRREKPLTLEELSAIAGRTFKTWDEVDPPRDFNPPDVKLETPWATLWEHFRRHLVDVHYDELAQWLTEAGIPRGRIWSSQGFNPPSQGIGYEPFPTWVYGPAKHYDTGGISIQGAVPAMGHLGGVIYGESAYNIVPTESRDSLFRLFRDFDPEWAAVEYSTATFVRPTEIATTLQAYRGMRDLLNYGARLVSPMAGTGSPGWLLGQPGFLGDTAYRGPPLATVTRKLKIERADLPRQARLWSFGLGLVQEDDGWSAPEAGAARAAAGGLEVELAAGRTLLDSPAETDFTTKQLDLLILGLREGAEALKVEVQGRFRGRDGWIRLTQSVPLATLRRSPAGHELPLARYTLPIEQFRIVIESPAARTIHFDRIALYPVQGSKRAHR